MSKTVIESVPPGIPLNDTRDDNLPTAPVPDVAAVVCGYFIALQADGTLVFEIVGSQPGIIQLLGLNVLATERLQNKTDMQLGGKFSVLMDKVEKVIENTKIYD